MAQVTFKAKVRHVRNVDGSHAFNYVDVPALTRAHCDLGAFRSHPKLGQFANSDLFPAILRQQAENLGVKTRIRLDNIPAGVIVDTSGFLATVSFKL